MEILLHEEGFEIALRLVLKVDMFKFALILYKQKGHLKGPTFATTKAYWFHIQI